MCRPVPVAPPDVAIYEGTDVAESTRSIVLTITAGARVLAIVRDGKQATSFIHPTEPSGAASGAHALVDVARAPGGAARALCDNHLAAPGTLGPFGRTSAAPASPRTPPGPTLAGEILVDVGYDLYTAQFGSSSTTASEYATGLFGAVSAIYRRDVDVAILIDQLVIWTAPEPFGGGDRSVVQLNSYRSYNETARVGVPRDVAHLLANLEHGGGIAYVDVLCNDAFGYGVSNLDGFYSSFPTTGYLWDVNVVAHELGHNFGSPHTHCYQPPIDKCYRQEPGCFSGIVHPTVGETMSYCHLNATIEMGFGSVVGGVIRGEAEGGACIGAAPGVCGDGVADPGEQCDDGNVAGGDCCTSNCVVEVGEACADDGDPCTTDVCDELAACTHEPPGSCTSCDAPTVVPAAGGTFPGTTTGPNTLLGTCGGGAAPEQVFAWTPDVSGLARVDTCGSALDTILYVRTGACETGPQLGCNDDSSCGQQSAASFYVEAGTTYYLIVDGYSGAGSFTVSVAPPGCAAAPLAGCKLPTLAGKAKLQLRDKLDDSKDQLSWSWTKGASTTVANLGNPIANDGYVLCVYDAGGPVLSAAVPPGGVCLEKPCWTAKSGAFGYKNNLRTPQGIGKLDLKTGVAGKAKIGAKGKGALLQMPSLGGLVPPLRVQLVRPGGPCWEASYSAPFVKPDGSQLSGKSD